MFMRITATIEPVVTEGWEIVIENSIAIVLGDASELNYTVHLIFRVWQNITIVEELFEVCSINLSRHACFRGKSRIFCVFFFIIVFVHNERLNESEDWFVKRIHSDKLTSCTDEFFHFMVESRAFLMALLFADLACEHFTTFQVAL